MLTKKIHMDGNQYLRLLYSTDSTRETKSRLNTLQEFFKAMYDNDTILSSEEVSEIISHTLKIAEKHKDAISEID